jgi:glycosyltransferase involved in cell wall biosynthesis
MKLSICIPTYNRAKHLTNCINSIILCGSRSTLEFQVCISDNHSTDETEEVVRHAKSAIEIKYHKNTSNLGIPRNFLKVVSMADGDFVWLIGDDDLLMPNAIIELYKLIDGHPTVDFFYVNSFHLNMEFLKSFPSPFDTSNLPKNMMPFSNYGISGEMNFLDLINPKISFDFLGGMFLSVFRKSHWERNAYILDKNAIMDDRTFSHFDNTFPHIKIFAKAFSSSTAYFNSIPLNVCLTGAREWAPMYPFIHSVRLVEALSEYRKNGLSYWKYVNCKNYALNNFIPDFINILLYKDRSGYAYIRPFKLMLDYCLYPNFYLSFFYFMGRLLRKYSGRLLSRNN